ncbi:MAG: histidine--tRNA ligase [Actinomycetia bacterium]|nr:histidine--tRNA ligase [Actinomycetes bacterium]
MAFRSPTGTQDLLPAAARQWQVLQDRAAQVFSLYGYQPVETPTFEYLDVFARGIGEATDVVGKEMFRVLSANRLAELATGAETRSALTEELGSAASAGDAENADSLALRPEMTAGVVRAVVQANLLPAGASALKLYYAGSMFRYERPQKGRLREFHQIGAECLGAAEPSADVELIEMMMRYLTELGLPAERLVLKLNSMGDDQCRPAYRQMVREFILAQPELCPDCQRRAHTNPLRAFDCKNSHCQDILAAAPRITESLCPDCSEHYARVKSLLSAEGIAFAEDHRLVRGLDYYTRTVFEVQVTSGLGSQNAIGGGGRYDKLVAEFGGNPTPGLGFALGFERIALVLNACAGNWAALTTPLVYVAAVDDSCRADAWQLARVLRQGGLATELDHQRRSLRSQFKVADKSGARYVVIVGPDELASGQAKLRDMTSSREIVVPIVELPGVIAANQTVQ